MQTEINEIDLKKIETINIRLALISIAFFLICLSISLFYVDLRFKILLDYLLEFFVFGMAVVVLRAPSWFYLQFYEEQLKLNPFDSKLEPNLYRNTILFILGIHFFILTTLNVLLYHLKVTKILFFRALVFLMPDTSAVEGVYSLLIFFFPLILILIYVILNRCFFKPIEKRKELKIKSKTNIENLQNEGWILMSEWDREKQIACDFKILNGQEWVRLRNE